MAALFKQSALLLATSLLISAATPPSQQNSQGIVLTVIATSRNGQPIADLTPGDLTLTDNGASEQIANLALQEETSATPLVVLFDLMDLTLSARDNIAQQLKRSLVDVPQTTPVSVYFILPTGQLQSVVSATSDLATSNTRSQRIGRFSIKRSNGSRSQARPI